MLSDDDAKDIFQETMISIYKNIKQDEEFTLQYSFKTYLFSICKNLIRDKLKFEYKIKAKKIVGGVELDEVINMDNDNEDTCKFQSEENRIEEMKKNLFRKYFFQLEADCQKSLTLFMDDKSFDEIAKIMGYRNEAIARIKKHKCKKYLTNMIKKDNLFQFIQKHYEYE
jgi:RNA polymerase sigma factor (sigma-70 family)